MAPSRVHERVSQRPFISRRGIEKDVRPSILKAGGEAANDVEASHRNSRRVVARLRQRGSFTPCVGRRIVDFDPGAGRPVGLEATHDVDPTLERGDGNFAARRGHRRERPPRPAGRRLRSAGCTRRAGGLRPRGRRRGGGIAAAGNGRQGKDGVSGEQKFAHPRFLRGATWFPGQGWSSLRMTTSG